MAFDANFNVVGSGVGDNRLLEGLDGLALKRKVWRKMRVVQKTSHVRAQKGV